MGPPRDRSRRVRPPGIGAAVLVVVLAVLFARYALESPRRIDSPTSSEQVRVERVVDGDTLLLADRTRVRLIGVNTPETVKPDTPPQPWGAEASQFTRDFLARRKVRLEFDEERLDQHGRTLAFVWVGDKLLNEELIRAGLGRAEMHFHYASEKKDRFRAAQQEAKKQQRGIWSNSKSTQRRGGGEEVMSDE